MVWMCQWFFQAGCGVQGPKIRAFRSLGLRLQEESKKMVNLLLIHVWIRGGYMKANDVLLSAIVERLCWKCKELQVWEAVTVAAVCQPSHCWIMWYVKLRIGRKDELGKKGWMLDRTDMNLGKNILEMEGIDEFGKLWLFATNHMCLVADSSEVMIGIAFAENSDGLSGISNINVKLVRYLIAWFCWLTSFFFCAKGRAIYITKKNTSYKTLIIYTRAEGYCPTHKTMFQASQS